MSLAGSQLRIRRILEAQDLRPAMLMEPNGLHRLVLSMTTVGDAASLPSPLAHLALRRSRTG